MTWRTVSQLAAAAVVGAGIFEAGKFSAYREILRGDRIVPAENDGPIRPKRISEPKKRIAPSKNLATDSVTKPEQKIDKPTEFRRKKYADAPLSVRDGEFIAAMEATMQKGDFAAARKMSETAQQSSRREVREAAVRMLAWFGKLGIAELTVYLADKDDSVATDAAAEWKRIFANECGDAEKLSVAALAMNKLTSASMLDDIGVEDVFNEVSNEGAAAETLIGIIGQGNPAGVKVAKSAYETLTGEAWSNEAAARKWIKENGEN